MGRGCAKGWDLGNAGLSCGMRRFERLSASKAVVVKVGSPDQQWHLGTCQNAAPDILKLQGWGQQSALMRAPALSGEGCSVRPTALEMR